MTTNARAVALVLTCLSISSLAHANQPGDVTFPFSLGSNLYTHRFGVEGKSASNSSVADRFSISEFPGAGYFVTDRLRFGLNFQFTQALSNPPAAGRFTVFGILPQINYRLGGSFLASVVPTFLVRYDAHREFVFGVQAVLTAIFPLGRGFAASVGVEVPVFFTPFVSIGITPLVGIVYRLPRRSERHAAPATAPLESALPTPEPTAEHPPSEPATEPEAGPLLAAPH